MRQRAFVGGEGQILLISSTTPLSPPAQKISSSRPPCSEVDDTKSSPETSFKSIFCAVRTWNHENQTTARADEMEPWCITAIILPITIITIIIIAIIITLSPYLELTTDLDGLGWLSRSYQILTAPLPLAPWLEYVTKVYKCAPRIWLPFEKVKIYDLYSRRIPLSKQCGRATFQFKLFRQHSTSTLRINLQNIATQNMHPVSV